MAALRKKVKQVRATVTVLALALSVMAAGCGSSSGPTSDILTATGATRSLVMIIRHGEKPDGSHPGVDAKGNPDDSSLTETGWNRANRLVDLFAPAQHPPRSGLARPTAIYAAGATSDGEGMRTRETVQPLADALGITVNTKFGKGDEKALVKDATARSGVTLICWQHGEIPAIVEAFRAVSPAAPSTWPDDRFDVVWTLTRTTNGWHFAQLPELALPQDQPGVIQD
jgi:hypothetical protein